MTVLYGCNKSLETPPVATINAENISLKSPGSAKKIDFADNNATIVFGDSWSDYDYNANNFIKLFADTSAQIIFNKAGIGLGSANMVAKAFETMAPVHNSTNIMALSGFNDVRISGATAELINFQRNAFTALLANQFIDTWKPAGAADRAGGRFTSFDYSLNGHFKSHYSAGRKAAYTSSVNGVYLEYDFTGSNIGVSFVGQDTTALAFYDHPHGRWRVLIDGVVIDTPAIHQQAQGHTPGYMTSQSVFPYIKIYTGLSNGNHVLRLEPVESGTKFLDFVFTLRDPSFVSPVVIMKVPYMTESGYSIDPPFDKANDAAIDLVNQAITDVRDMFISFDPGYSKKIKLINTSEYFDRNTDYLPDLIHPNASGKINLYKALVNNISF
jgi:hypothetical protein